MLRKTLLTCSSLRLYVICCHSPNIYTFSFSNLFRGSLFPLLIFNLAMSLTREAGEGARVAAAGPETADLKQRRSNRCGHKHRQRVHVPAAIAAQWVCLHSHNTWCMRQHCPLFFLFFPFPFFFLLLLIFIKFSASPQRQQASPLHHLQAPLTRQQAGESPHWSKKTADF